MLTTNSTIRVIQPHKKLHQFAPFIVGSTSAGYMSLTHPIISLTSCNRLRLSFIDSSNQCLSQFEKSMVHDFERNDFEDLPKIQSSVIENNTIYNIGYQRIKDPR